MSTGLAPSESGSFPKSAARTVDYDNFIETQLRKTRGQVKIVEIAGALMTMGLAAVAFFLVAALLDHWIIPHGLNTWGRVLLCLAFVGGAGFWLATVVLPALFGRVNPIYAAQAIERSKPSIKNSLINFLLLRPRREKLSPHVYRALEEQAATGITNLPVETAVDRTRLIHVGYALVALVGVFALYFLISPKNPFATAARVIAPWADLQAPARVTIDDVKPGDATAFRGQPVKVSAEIAGLSGEEAVLLIYSTADRQVVDRPVAMQLPSGGYRHQATLPEGETGVQQDIEYRIEAGDARSRTYRIEATAAPVIVVESVEFKYPDYTGIESAKVKNRGDLKAIEGTQVTVRAAANQPIKSASIDFACDGKQDRALKVTGEKASITFTLAMNKDRSGPEFDSYQLRFVNSQGIENPKPVRHSIEVIPDLPPEVHILSPEQEEIEVPLNGAVTLEVKARDPDYALATVRLEAKTGRGPLFDKSLLQAAPHRGQFVGKYEFSPELLKLKVGDVVHYQAIAADNKTPQASKAYSSEKRIRVTEPDPVNERHQRDQQQDAQNQERQDKKQQGDRNEGKPQQQNRDPQNREQQDGRDANDQGNNEKQNPDLKNGKQNPQNNQRNEQNNKQDPQDQQQDQHQKPDQQNDQNKNDQKQQKQQEQQKGDSKQEDGSKGGSGEKQDGSEKGDQEGQEGGEGGSGKSSKKNEGEQKQEGNQAGGQGGQGENQGEQKNPQEGSQQGGQQSGENNQSGKASENQQNQGGKQGDGSQQDQVAQNNTGENSEGSQSKQQQGQSSGQGDNNQRGSSQENSPVPSDGRDDGRGVEQILKHRNQQQPGDKNQESGDKSQQHGDKSQQQQAGDRGEQPDKQPQPGEKQEERGDRSGQGDPQDQRSEPQSGDPNSEKSGEKNAGEQNSSGEKSDGMKPGENQQPNGKSEGSENQTGQNAGSQNTGNQSQNNQSGNQSPNQQNPSGDSSQQPKPGDEKKPGETGTEENKPEGEGQRDPSQSEQPGGQQPMGDQPGGGQEKQPGGENSQGERPGEKQSGQNQSGEQKSSQEQSGQNRLDKNSEQSGQEKGKPQSEDGEQQKEGEKQPDAASQNKQGDSGAGKKDDEGGNSPDSQQTAKPKNDKGEDSTNQKKQGEGESPSVSPHESKSKGDQDGSQSGGGAKGGGQDGKQPGKGSAGQNTAAEDGSGTSEEPGKGEKSNKAGRDQPSDKPTGQSGQEKGEGAKSRKSDDGKQPGDQRSKNNQSGNNAQGKGSSEGGDPQGGGSTPQAPIKPDEANLEYAKKATELALDHLKNSLKKGGKDADNLLDQLGWTREEAQQFIERQERRLQNVKQPNVDDADRREAEDALRSLGLRPPRTERTGADLKSDKQRGLSSGRSTSPPPEYAEQYKAYSQGINQTNGNK